MTDAANLALPAEATAIRSGTARGLTLGMGREFRYVLRLYLERTFMFLMVALAIILALDAASNFSGIMSADTSPSGLDGPLRMTFYLLLRAGYVLPSLLPIAAFAGVVWAEHGLATSQERIMIFNSGRPPLRSLVTALLFGLVAGLCQLAALAYVRPASVEAQGVSHFRYYGPKFDQPVTTGPRWIVGESAVINARVEIGMDVALHDVLLYGLGDAGGIESIVSAALATPGPNPGTWTFQNGSMWRVPPFLQPKATGEGSMQAITFDALERPLQLDPLWVRNFDVSPPLIAQSELAGLAAGGSAVPNSFAYRLAYEDRFAEIAYCAGMALLGAAVCLLRFSPKMSPFRPLEAAAYAGGAYVLSNILPMLGTYGRIPSLAAAWTMPVLLICFSVGLIYRPHRAVKAHLRSAQGGRAPRAVGGA
jgi:lipopolysaccharide export LptBFGC system permease protein LptF